MTYPNPADLAELIRAAVDAEERMARLQRRRSFDRAVARIGGAAAGVFRSIISGGWD